MRRISRQAQAPEFLSSPRVREARGELFEFLRRPLEERRQRRAPLHEDIFYDSDFGIVLGKLFAGKCAYCESPLNGMPVARHFRPLQFAEPAYGIDTLHHYTWLAFEWQNLLVACDFCEKSKNTQFPLQRGPRASFLARIDDVREQEYPLLLDPCFDNPRLHLQFLSDGSCVHKTERGASTIVALSLNRPDLVAARQEAVDRWLGLLTVPASQDRFVDMIVGRSTDRLFELETPHLAAALDVLRRVLNNWRGNSSRDVPQLTPFLRNTCEEISSADDRSRERLADAARELRSSEMARGPALRAAVVRDAPTEDFSMDPVVVPRRPIAFDREIRQISISNVKAIDELVIDLPSVRTRSAGVPCLAILGENSTGKSTVLAAIALALIGARQASRLKLGASHLLSSAGPDRFDQLQAQPAEVVIDYFASDDRALFRLDPESAHVLGQAEPTSVVLAYGPRRYFSPRFRDRSAGARHRVKTLFDPLATIPYPNDWLSSLTNERFETVARALRIVLALNDEDHLTADPEDGMCVEANGRRTPVEWLSEGYKSVFAMVVDIIHELLDHYPTLEQAQAVVLIDEIETHLHPRWKMQIMTSLRRALPRVQFIVTTHDPLCLRGMDDDEVLVLQRVEGAKIRPLKGLPSVKGMSAEELLTSDYFGLSSTTDPTIELDLARVKGDVIVRNAAGESSVTLSTDTEQLLKSVSLGNSASETLIQDAVSIYLADRESGEGKLRSDVRDEAIESIVAALRAPFKG